MTIHREEGTFDIRIELSAEFDEEYEGDADGYAWLESWRSQVRPRIARAVMSELRADAAGAAGLRVSAVPTSRGKSSEDELVISVELRVGREGPREPREPREPRDGERKGTESASSK